MNYMEEVELEKIWKSVLSEIELQIPRASFATWLKQSRLLEKKDGMALVALPNNFTRAWVENKYNKVILGTIRLLDDSTKNVKFIVQNTKTLADGLDMRPGPASVTREEKKQLIFF